MDRLDLRGRRRVIDAAVEALRSADRPVVFTGAGMSADSGLATFRDPHEGLWARFRPEELASPDAWRRDRALVWAWYQWRLADVLTAQPNDGHRAVAAWGAPVVTQNVDDLHERAGSTDVLHLHGSIAAPRCDSCAQPHDVVPPPAEPAERLEPPVCPRCGGAVRPGVVWFGESVPGYDRAVDVVRGADALVVVGTSGVVQPAAGLTDLAIELGIPVVEANPDAREREGVVVVPQRAAEALPPIVRILTAS